MAKNKIVLAELDLDTKALVKSMEDIKKEIEQVQQRQGKLTASGKEASAQFSANATAINKMETAYRAQQAALAELTNEESKSNIQIKAIKKAYDEVNATENDYMRNNEELIRLKKELITTEDGYQIRLKAINEKLLENTNWLKENGSAHARLGTTMSDFKQQALDSYNSINVLNGGFSGLVSRAQEAGGVGPLVSGAFQGMAAGIMGMTRSAIAFIATPFGLVLAALAAAFALVQNAMNSSSESAGKITRIFSSFSVVTDSLLKLLAPLGDFLIDGIAAGFDMAGKAAEAAMGWISSGLALLGFDESAESVRSFTNEVARTAAETTNLKKAQEELAAQMAVQEAANETAKQQMDELIRKSEDQTKTEKDRVVALSQAAAIETKNYEDRRKLADEAYGQAVRRVAMGKGLSQEEETALYVKGAAYAQTLMKIKGVTQEELDVLKNAQTAKTRIFGEEAQMMASQAAAREKMEAEFAAKREAAAQKREQQEAARRAKVRQDTDDAIQRQKLELDLYIENQGIKARTMAQELALAEEIAKRKTAIADAEFKASDRSAKAKLQLDLANAQITNDLAKAQQDAAIANAKKHLDDYIAANQSKLDNEKFLSQELYTEEVSRLNKIKEEQIIYEKARLDQGVINQEAYNAEIKRIDDENKAAGDALLTEREEAEKAKQAADLQNKMATDTANMDYDLGFQLQKIDAERQQELDAAEKTGADKSLINARYDKQEVDAKKMVMDNKIALADSTFSNLATILGKESAAGKAIAVAQATMDTYKSAVSAYSSLAGIPVVGPALGAVAAAAAVAAGIANVKKITSTKPPKAEKGALFSIGGNRHSAGGTMFTGADGTQFEAEKGELIGVMNRNAASHFMAFNNAFPAGGSSAPNYFAGGGIVSREITPQGLNADELAAKIADANRTLPAPVVAVQDILSESSNYVKVRDGANF